MDGVKVAWRSWLAAHRFLFWAVIEAVTRSIYWWKEANRELLILKPRTPQDLYENGYALFAYDVTRAGWIGHWRAPGTPPGTLVPPLFRLLDSQWGYVPFHEVEFSDMPHITFKVRAVSVDWCRTQQIDFEEQPLQVAA